MNATSQMNQTTNGPAEHPNQQTIETPSPEIMEPPRHWGGILRSIGPGLIIAGSIVGSGELIATTKTGAQAGISLLWLILFGCIIKVFVQIEIGRHTILHGETSLKALNRVPGKLGPLNFFVWFWLLMMLSGVAQLGGIVGGVGQAAALAFPVWGDYERTIKLPTAEDVQQLQAAEGQSAELTAAQLETQQRLEQAGEQGKLWYAEVAEGKTSPKFRTWDDLFWAALIAVCTSCLLWIGRYQHLQQLTTILVVSFTVITIGNVIALQMTPQWQISLSEIWYGLSFHLPEVTGNQRPIATALATFGIIGVGSAELIAYPYWCLEKGYAKSTGPYDGSEAWYSRAKGWLKVLQFDAYLSMVVYTVATIAFFLMGVAVLHKAGLDPDNKLMVSTLAEAYVPVFGTYAKLIFLIGAVAVLFSTFLVALASHARMYTDLFCVLGKLDRTNDSQVRLVVQCFGFLLPLVCLLIFGTQVNPVSVVLLSGTMQALFLPMVGIATLFYRYRYSDARLQPGLWWDVLLITSCLAFLVTGVWSFASKWEEVMAFIQSM